MANMGITKGICGYRTGVYEDGFRDEVSEYPYLEPFISNRQDVLRENKLLCHLRNILKCFHVKGYAQE
jgi:hypothetical protein